jgi:hypothetical protein
MHLRSMREYGDEIPEPSFVELVETRPRQEQKRKKGPV